MPCAGSVIGCTGLVGEHATNSAGDDSREPGANLPSPDARGLDVYRIDGPEPYPNGLGPPVPGQNAKVPDAPRWRPVDPGSDQAFDADGNPLEFTGESRWNTEEPSWGEKWAAAIWRSKAAAAYSRGWDNAGRNLEHYLDAKGKNLPTDVDGLLREAPTFRQEVEKVTESTEARAVDDARARGVNAPITYSVNTPWSGATVRRAESENWFMASGSFDYNIDGKVTTDKEMARLHVTGLAQEYTLVGESSPRHRTGSFQ